MEWITKGLKELKSVTTKDSVVNYLSTDIKLIVIFSEENQRNFPLKHTFQNHHTC